MQIFISWSGAQSLELAKLFASWIPTVLQATRPWLSKESLESGVRWTPELEARLRDSNFGIVSVTPASQDAPWLLFEAGAMSKLLDARVVPVVYEVSKALTGPLGQFQARDTTKEDVASLMGDINTRLGDKAIAAHVLNAQIDRCWPEFEAGLLVVKSAGASQGARKKSPERDQGEMVEEILLRVREIQRGAAVRDDVLFRSADGERTPDRGSHIRAGDVIERERFVARERELNLSIARAFGPLEGDDFRVIGTSTLQRGVPLEVRHKGQLSKRDLENVSRRLRAILADFPVDAVRIREVDGPGDELVGIRD
jgi:hypothetical protein